MKHFKSIHRFFFKSFAVEVSQSKTINDLTVFTSDLMKFESPKKYFKFDKMIFKGNIAQKFDELNKLLFSFQNLLITTPSLNSKTEELLIILRERHVSNVKIQNFLNDNRNYNVIMTQYSFLKLAILDFFPAVEEQIPEVILFADLIEILREFNIIDVEIWKKVFRFLFLYCEHFKTLSNFLSILSAVSYKILPMLRMNGFDEYYNSKTVFYLKESNLVLMIKSSYFNLFYEKLTRIHKFYDCQGDPNLIAQVLILVSNIKSKFIKVSYMDSNSAQALYSQWDDFLCKNYDRISLKNMFLLFDQYSYSGLSQNFISLFEKRVLSSLDLIITENLNLMRILNGWKNIGRFNKEIYEKLMRNFIIQKLNYSFTVKIYAKIGFSLICIGILNEDKELWKLYLQNLGKINLTKIDVLNKRILHSVFQILGLFTEIMAEVKNEQVKTLIESLNIECINSNNNKETENEIFNGKQAELTSIDNNLPINCIECQSIEFIKKNGKKIKSDLIQLNCINENSIQENKIYKALVKLYENDQNVRIIRNYSVCLYDADIAIFFIEKKEKIAIEISGSSYIFHDNEFLGKKKLKFEILKKLGWKVLVLNINEKKLFNMLGIPSSREKQFQMHMGEYLQKRINEL